MYRWTHGISTGRLVGGERNRQGKIHTKPSMKRYMEVRRCFPSIHTLCSEPSSWALTAEKEREDMRDLKSGVGWMGVQKMTGGM